MQIHASKSKANNIFRYVIETNAENPDFEASWRKLINKYKSGELSKGKKSIKRYMREIGVVFDNLEITTMNSIKELSIYMTGKDLSMIQRWRHKKVFNAKKLTGRPNIQEIIRYTTTGETESY